MKQTPIKFYPPRVGGPMNLTFKDICLAVIAAALVVAVLWGFDITA